MEYQLVPALARLQGDRVQVVLQALAVAHSGQLAGRRPAPWPPRRCATGRATLCCSMRPGCTGPATITAYPYFYAHFGVMLCTHMYARCMLATSCEDVDELQEITRLHLGSLNQTGLNQTGLQMTMQWL